MVFAKAWNHESVWCWELKNPSVAGLCGVRKTKLEPTCERALKSQRNPGFVLKLAFRDLECVLFRNGGLGVQRTPGVCEACALSSAPHTEEEREEKVWKRPSDSRWKTDQSGHTESGGARFSSVGESELSPERMPRAERPVRTRGSQGSGASECLAPLVNTQDTERGTGVWRKIVRVWRRLLQFIPISVVREMTGVWQRVRRE